MNFVLGPNDTSLLSDLSVVAMPISRVMTSVPTLANVRTNGSHLLGQYHKSSHGIPLHRPTRFILVMMRVLAADVQSCG